MSNIRKKFVSLRECACVFAAYRRHADLHPATYGWQFVCIVRDDPDLVWC